MPRKGTRAWSSVPKDKGLAKGASAARADGWQNLLTGFGDVNRDKRMSGQVSGYRLTWEQCADLWRYDDMAARAVEVPVEEMTREGWDVLIPGDKDSMEAVQQAQDELGVVDAFVEGLHYQRAFGGGVVLVGADDGQTLDKPLREDRIKSIDFLTVLKPREAQGITYYADAYAPKFGQTEMYRVIPELSLPSSNAPWLPEVHESRMILFQGAAVSRRQLRENFGYGDSIFVRIVETIRDFQQAFGASGALLQDFSQAAFSINGLREMLAADDGSKRLKNRLVAMDTARSYLRALILDAGDSSGMGKETFERIATPVEGLPDLLDRWSQRLAAACDMPVERLLGETTKGGLGSGGNSKIEWWEKHCANLQRRDLKRPVRRICELLFLAKNGPTGGNLPKTWSVRMRPLSQLSGVEEAARRLSVAQADQIYMATGAITPEEVATSRYGGDEYSTETQLDDSMRNDLQEAIDRKSEDVVGKPDPVEAAKQLAAAMPPGAVPGKPGVPKPPPGKPAPKP